MRRELAARLGAEFTIIVLGVLVALGVDDLRAGRADLAREAYFLAGVAEDLRADIVDYEAAWENAQLRVAASSYITTETGSLEPVGSTVLGIGEGVSASFVPDSGIVFPRDLTEGLQQLALVANFDVARGTYEEILSTGSFGVIRSEELRRGISRYYAFAADRGNADDLIQEALLQYYDALTSAGLAPGDDGDLLRRLPPVERARLMASIRVGWNLAAIQAMIAKNLEGEARALLSILEQQAVAS